MERADMGDQKGKKKKKSMVLLSLALNTWISAPDQSSCFIKS